jgi:geranylgeranyl pyrophosphate synthase
LTFVLDQVTQRLQQVVLLPELRRALQDMVAYDQGRLMRNPQWGMVIPTVQRVLGGAEEHVAPFAAAWSLMYAAIVRLDHLQDGDPAENALPTIDRPSAQYNLVFSYYVLGTSLLDMLSPDYVPVHRILRLRRFWTDMLLRMASGQQRDLTACEDDCESLSLDYYQQLAQAKTGATFALAFGGTALLLTDDTRTIDVLTLVGEIYGTLLQYSDDLHDATAQPNATVTLPKVLAMVRPAHVSELTGHTSIAFGAYLYHSYYEQVVRMLAELPAGVQQGILELFDKTFLVRRNAVRDEA